ncbi:glycoside hydrolase family 9 protein [Telluribacter sp. SYSU D00476]|uniref:glycoside hydrolase family 9 protein n=1 Tax=Telluribacter sp. SYSU D00476 TaxID=2811430 RepID=UPI001FF18CCA|nr:glycoside hydrolase family 9 protein [Telluribacter sp. SYSU D00476]
MHKVKSLLVLLAGTIGSSVAQTPTEKIRLNQIGYYPDAPKVAVVVGEEAQGPFQIKEAGSNKVVFKGTLSAPRSNQHSGKKSRIADFSGFTKRGNYVVEIPGVGTSYSFSIKPAVHREVAAASLKGFYYQRISTPLPEKYAGKWARPAGHPDDQVLIHPSAASAERPAGSMISSPGGWYDAGDYNKYIVNSGITVGTLLSLYEDFPQYTRGLDVNIPESGDQVPDLLDETLYNLRWMLTMQDPNDGGVYHKLTNPSFDGMVMPDKATKPRYVIQKNTIATLNFIAVTAQAARILDNYKKELPGLADSCRTAALKGWDWVKKNPNVLYDQNEMNKQFDPDVSTGSYQDRNGEDEWIWAATELYVTTGQDKYLQGINLFPDATLQLPSWNQVRALAYYTLARSQKKLPAGGAQHVNQAKQVLLKFADDLLTDLDKQPYHTVMGKTKGDYIWGSSAVAANQGITLIQAYQLSGDRKYLHAALGNLDYIMGRNATGYSFLTGFGHKTPMRPHHRPSVADGIEEPVPGLLSGGPNPGQQDKCKTYTSNFADESFTDDDCSYASNEIAINWNAPMVYLATAVEALMEKKK